VTLIVGILCADGVVMASDSAATLGTGAGLHTIGQQQVKKILNLSSHVLYGSTGAVGMAQLISNVVSTTWKAHKDSMFAKGSDGDVMKLLGEQIAKTVMPFLQTASLTRQLGVDGGSAICKSLVAVPVQRVPTLFTFDVGGQPEMATRELPFVAVGSGQQIADPFLAFLKRLIWAKREPTLAEGRLVAVWTLQHVIRTTPGGVGGDIQLWMLPKVPNGLPTTVEVTKEQIEEHKNNVGALERGLIAQLVPPAATDDGVPPPPEAPQGTAAAAAPPAAPATKSQ
jgi:20S proteasome alpha/beta subunit